MINIQKHNGIGSMGMNIPLLPERGVDLRLLFLQTFRSSGVRGVGGTRYGAGALTGVRGVGGTRYGAGALIGVRRTGHAASWVRERTRPSGRVRGLARFVPRSFGCAGFVGGAGRFARFEDRISGLPRISGLSRLGLDRNRQGNDGTVTFRAFGPDPASVSDYD